MKYTVKGVGSETDTCEHCGKTNLKKVVWLSQLDADGNEAGTIAVGTTCAGVLLYGRKSKQNGETSWILARAARLAKIWAERGFTLEEIENGIWNKFGMQSSIKDGGLFLHFGGVHKVL